MRSCAQDKWEEENQTTKNTLNSKAEDSGNQTNKQTNNKTKKKKKKRKERVCVLRKCKHALEWIEERQNMINHSPRKRKTTKNEYAHNTAQHSTAPDPDLVLAGQIKLHPKLQHACQQSRWLVLRWLADYQLGSRDQWVGLKGYTLLQTLPIN